MTIGLNHRPYTDAFADRLWEQHAAGLQGLSKDDLWAFVERITAPLDPGTGEISVIVERLQQRKRDNARPSDSPTRGSDPMRRLLGG